MPRIAQDLPQHDYDSKDFYLAIEALAVRGCTDKEIADELLLAPQTFAAMKNSRYKGWNEEKNEKRGERIRECLERARRKTNQLVRSTYLKMALGQKKVLSQTRRYVEDRCECGGQDPECRYCGGTGKIIRTDKAIVQETESEMPPSLQALSTWLHHFDPEWTQTEAGAAESAEGNVKKGIDIKEWVGAMTQDKALTHEQGKMIEKNETETEIQ